eukprot:scaffold19773_cov43-Cyclotella_meneghiniana.AAC.6
MSQKIPLSSSLAECVTIPPYTSDADQDASRRFFILHYMSFAELRDDGSWNIRAEETEEFRIPPKNENLQDALDRWEKEQRPHEAFMHVPSDNRTPSSNGGIYASASVGSMRRTFESLNDSELFRRYTNENPIIAQRRIRFLNIGAGFNRPAYIAAVLLGWISHGLECNVSRAIIASSSKPIQEPRCVSPPR